MDAVSMSTVVFADREAVFEFLRDFEGYGKYSEHVRDVDVNGDGDVGTEYAITFGWWKLTYTARSRVVDVDPPSSIRWEIVKDVDAHGQWRLEALDLDADRDEIDDPVPSDATAATRVSIDVSFDAGSVGSDALDLPLFVSLDWVLERAKPLVAQQAGQVLRRVVADLEGRERTPALHVHETPDSVDVDRDDLDVSGN
ncbi:SRPBCC family protein [Halobaculum sp. D14]|uniref:SRPBCC family protein n=1 Tax=Halobaculum sp. D14 TaxID=3421642 RepID=UPI003EBE6EA0